MGGKKNMSVKEEKSIERERNSPAETLTRLREKSVVKMISRKERRKQNEK